jgi:hypothetical protein
MRKDEWSRSLTPFAKGEEVQRSDPTTIPGSSVVEQLAVNQLAAGSNPAPGAI